MGSDESEILEDAGAVIGEEAHIRSGSQGGPRHDPAYHKDKVDKYQNLLLLCPTHHAIIDKEGGRGFSIDDQERIKREHELSISRQVGPEGERSREFEERMLASIMVWEKKAGLESWGNLTYKLTTAIPSLSTHQYDGLVELGRWLLSGNWPRSRFPQIARSFDNMRAVLGDLINHLNECGDVEEGHWQIRREYKEIGWNPERYQTLLVKFKEERSVLYGLVIELTKAVNWTIQIVAAELDPFYRFDSGIVLLFAGDLVRGELFIRVEYSSEFDGELPYVGVDKIWEAVKAMDGQLNWQALLNLADFK